MSRTQSLFEKLNETSNQVKQMDQLKKELDAYKSMQGNASGNIINVERRLGLLEDNLQSRAKSDDLANISSKFHKEMEEMKKVIDTSEIVKKSVENVKKEFLAEIPINIEVGESGDLGKPLVEKNPEHEI